MREKRRTCVGRRHLRSPHLLFFSQQIVCCALINQKQFGNRRNAYSVNRVIPCPAHRRTICSEHATLLGTRRVFNTGVVCACRCPASGSSSSPQSPHWNFKQKEAFQTKPERLWPNNGRISATWHAALAIKPDKQRKKSFSLEKNLKMENF